MSFGKRRKVDKPQILHLKKHSLNAIRAGELVVEPCKKKIKDGLSAVHKKMFFNTAVLHIPAEIDYLIVQTIEGMGYEQKDVRVAMHEGLQELRFEIFPPESV